MIADPNHGVDLPPVGATAEIRQQITAGDIAAFSALSGDTNPLHVDERYARQTKFRRPVAHGVLLASYVSKLIGMHLPGPGSLWMRQQFRWAAPVFANDTVTISARVRQTSSGTRVVVLDVRAVNQDGVVVMDGEGAVMLLGTSPVPELEQVPA